MASYQIYEDNSGEFRWRLTSGNDIIADSGEGYSSEGSAREAAQRVQRDAPEADILESGTPHFEIYKDRADEFRWRLISSNGRIVGDSGEGYSSESGARRAVENVMSDAATADIQA